MAPTVAIHSEKVLARARLRRQISLHGKLEFEGNKAERADEFEQ
jgi:hypothetical protein